MIITDLGPTCGVIMDSDPHPAKSCGPLSGKIVVEKNPVYLFFSHSIAFETLAWSETV